MSEKAEAEGKGNFWELAGIALVILAIGGCFAMVNVTEHPKTAAPVEVSK